MVTRTQIIGTVLLLSHLVATAAAQAVAPQKPVRHKVGVALSGGGALGLAHIGVIQYFEEHHIPIDVVAGTSMGGLVGGFFGAGIDSRGLKRIVADTEWDVLLNPNRRYGDEVVAEKQDWNKSAGNLTLRFARRFSLPAGLNSGEALALLLSRITAGYGSLETFDDLPTPFRCVATDLVSGEAVVLSRGSLPKAMRATMALPAVFTPVQWDDKVLVDGGLVQNIPVEVTRDMGANTTIAVSVQTAPVDQNQFKSMVGILRQVASIAVVQNEKRSLRLADLVIEVNTSRFKSFDYEKSEEIIRAGYEAAQAKAKELAVFEVPADEWAAYLRQRERRTIPTPQEGRVVGVEAPDPSFQENAKAELARKLGKGETTEPQLEDAISGIVAATDAPGASYHFDKPDGGYHIEFLPRPSESVLVRPSFRFGLSSGEPSRSALLLSSTFTAAQAYKSKLLVATTLGYDPGIRTEYYRPFDGTGYFIAPGFMVERFTVNTYSGSARTTATRDRFGVSFYAGVGTWRSVQVRAGLQGGYDSYSKPIVVDGVRASSHAFANPELTWIYDSQDSGGLPHRGTRIEGSAGYSFRDTSFPYLRSAFTSFKPLSGKVSVFGIGNVASSFGTKLNYYEQFTAGGSGQLSAFRYQEFHANTLVSGGGGVIIRGPEISSLSTYPGVALWYEAGRLDLGSHGWQTAQSASTGVFFSTPLGTAGVAVSFDAAGKARCRLSLGSVGQ